MSVPSVIGYDEQDDQPVDLDRWTALATAALAAEGVAEGELTLLFVDEVAMAELNELHMGETGATDVLSFPIDGNESGDGPGPTLLGDVVICPAVAARNAPAHAGTYDDELALLVVHGVLHVLGHDHAEPDETAVMQGRERELLDRLHRR